MKTKNLITLLGGAAAGAVAMYLLDPEAGDRRRRQIAQTAGSYVSEAEQALENCWDNVSGHARDLGHSISSAAHSYGDHLSRLAEDYSQRLVDHAKGAGQQIEDRTREMHDDLADRAGSWWRSGRKWLGRQANSAQDALQSNEWTRYGRKLIGQTQAAANRARERAGQMADNARSMISGHEEHSMALPIGVTALGCCALGAGLMFLVDPKRGRARRAWLMDSTTSWVRRTGNSFYGTGRHLVNRARGVMHDTRDASAQLVERVQTEISRVLANPKVVQVLSDANGTITLTGRVLAEEVDRILSLIETVPGVNLVVNHLEAIRRPEQSGQPNNSPPSPSMH